MKHEENSIPYLFHYIMNNKVKYCQNSALQAKLQYKTNDLQIQIIWSSSLIFPWVETCIRIFCYVLFCFKTKWASIIEQMPVTKSKIDPSQKFQEIKLTIIPKTNLNMSWNIYNNKSCIIEVHKSIDIENNLDYVCYSK